MRITLQAELFELKAHLARAGRDGRWSSFLREATIPRATADRYVGKHSSLIESPPANCLNEAITLTDADLDKLVSALRKKVVPRFRSRAEAMAFVERLSITLQEAFPEIE